MINVEGAGNVNNLSLIIMYYIPVSNDHKCVQLLWIDYIFLYFQKEFEVNFSSALK